MNKIKFQDLGRLHATIRKELDEAFDRVLKNSSFIQGVEVQAFEKEFSVFTGAPYCLGVSNGTDALEMALECIEITKGDVVAVPSMTFAATAEAVVRVGGTPIFIDVCPDTFCITPEILEKFIKNSNEKIKAVILVHLYGRACDMAGFKALSKKYEFKIIEDCAQAHGAFIESKHVGLWGDVGTFSFYPGKNLGALGDAGAIITKDESLYTKMKFLRDHGRTEKYLHKYIGRNARMDGLQAAFLRVKLKHLSEWTESRRNLNRKYIKYLEGLNGISLFRDEKLENAHSHHLFVIKIEDLMKHPRESLINYLKNEEIECLIQYPVGLHEQPAYQKYFNQQSYKDCNVTEKLSKKILSLPFDPLMDEEDVLMVCNKVRKFFET